MNMANIIVPDFMFNYIDRDEFSKIQKIFIFERRNSFTFYKVNNKELFSMLINIFFEVMEKYM